jgi:hypothetical protein
MSFIRIKSLYHTYKICLFLIKWNIWNKNKNTFRLLFNWFCHIDGLNQFSFKIKFYHEKQTHDYLGFILFHVFFFSDRVFHSWYKKKRLDIAPTNKQINKKSQRTLTANTQDNKTNKKTKHTHTHTHIYISTHRLLSSKRSNRRRENNITEFF